MAERVLRTSTSEDARTLSICMLVGLTKILLNCEIAEWVKSVSLVDYASAVAPHSIGSQQRSRSRLDQNRTPGGSPKNTATLSGCCSLKGRQVAGIESLVSVLTNPTDSSHYDPRFGSSPRIPEQMPRLKPVTPPSHNLFPLQARQHRNIQGHPINRNWNCCASR